MLRFLSYLGALCFWVQLGRAPAQSVDRAAFTGTVTDSTGAVVQGATVLLQGHAPFQVACTTDASGTCTVSAPAGTYVVKVVAEGFAPFVRQAQRLQRSTTAHLAIRLQVGGFHEEVSVQDEVAADPASPDSLVGITAFEGKGLDLLSNDPAMLQQQLGALAGGQPHFLIDGFSGGRLPPKTAIRSIRINHNMFSPYYADLGSNRVEIDTKPGTDKLHGTLNLSGTDRPLDAPNPYAGLQPPFYDFQQDGNLNGPLGKATSFLLSDSLELLANSSVVNATNPQALTQTISSATPSPQRTNTYALRVDRQFSPRQFGYVRDEWSRTHITNSGIVALTLPAAAFTSDALANVVQLSYTLEAGAHAVNEASFQYLRTRLQQAPNSTLPSIIVQGAFQDGGNPAQFLRDHQDSFEVRDRFECDHGAHSARFGFRFRALRDANASSAGFNGQYIFPDVASYQAGTPSQYSQTVGQQAAVLLTTDFALSAEDDWKLTPTFTLSYGLRFESQSAIPDHFDPAPRLAAAWVIRRPGHKLPLVTLRAGYGIFYDRFPAAQLLQSVRQNGSREVAYYARDTAFNPLGPPPGVVLGASQPTIFQVDPHLRSSYAQAGSFTASRNLGRFGALSANLLYLHNTHNFLTRNINAPLPGTYNPSDPDSGTRPLGTDANVYQFSSAGNGNREAFILRYQLQLGAHVTAYGVYDADRIYDESDDIQQFPSSPYNLQLDYGRDATDRAHTLTGGLSIALPLGFTLDPFLDVSSGAPFNITTGTDQNGDTLYNDRPAFASGGGSAATVHTAFGDFNVAPAVGDRPIPRNFGTAPGYFWLLVKAGRDFALGPRQDQAAASGTAPTSGRPWVLNFSVEAQNLTNHNNPGLPVGVLSAEPCQAAAGSSCVCSTAVSANSGCPLQVSRYFGHSLTLANGLSPITAANRILFFQTSFRW